MWYVDGDWGSGRDRELGKEHRIQNLNWIREFILLIKLKCANQGFSYLHLKTLFSWFLKSYDR